LSQREGVTLFMTVVAAFQVLLARYSGQDDISVGTPIANRTLPSIEGLIGFFVNTLVLRTDLSCNPSFLELLERVREVALGAYTHQDVPFEQIVKVLQPERDMSRSPLFQVMIGLQQGDQQRERMGGDFQGLTVRSLNVESVTSKFDLTLMITDHEPGLLCGVEYSTDLFDEPTIERMLLHFETLLSAIVAHPAEHIQILPLLTESEQEQLLQWNATQVEYPLDGCVHQLFESQVQRIPDAVALVSEEQILTYAELNRQANRLAHHLQRRGVGPEILVGVFLERSIEMVVALLAVLKAGGAYVPLDPATPLSRRGVMVEYAQMPIVLTQLNLYDCKQACEVWHMYIAQSE